MKKILEKFDFSNPSNYGYDPEITAEVLHDVVSELLRLLKAYDNYIISYAEDHGACADGCYPVCVEEFYDNEFKERKNK